MKKLLFFLLLTVPAFGQGSFYSLPYPLPNAVVRVCPTPPVGNPCTSPVSIFSDPALSLGIANPFSVNSTGQFGFWVSPGQYTIQIAQPYNLVYTVSLGGGGGSSGTVTIVSVTTANGVSGTVATPTTTPAITLSLGAINPSSIVDTGITTTPSTSPICPNGSGGAFTTSGCASGAPAFNTITPGINTTAGNSTTATSGMQVSGTATLSPASTGQIAGSQDWYQAGPGSVSPVPPTLAFSATGGALSGATYFFKVTYVGLSVIEPSGEVKITTSGCGANVCQITVTMPTSCTAGNLPAGVTGCTVWDSQSTGTEKQQAASAACVNITTTTCVVSTMAAGSTLTTPQTGITPAGAQAVTCPDNIIPTNWFQAADANFYNLAGIDISALNRGTPLGVFTFCSPVFFNDTSGPPVIANTPWSFHHQMGNGTINSSTNDDRTMGAEFIDSGTANPVAEQALTFYLENIGTNNNFQCNPINGGTPVGESCRAALRGITNDSRTGNVAGATSYEGLAGVASSSGATAQASGTAQGYVGVKGGAFQATNSQNGNSNTWIGGYFGANGASGNTNGTGVAVMAWAPTVRFATQNIGVSSQNFGSSINDWDFLALGNGSTQGKSMFQGQTWLPSIVASNSTIGITGSLNATGGIATSQLSAIGVNGAALSTFGTAGATSDSYKVTCVDVNGNETTASSTITINTANADLTAAHGNQISFSMSSGTQNLGCSSFNTYRTAASSTCNGGACTNGKLGNVAASTVSSSENFVAVPVFQDSGQVGDGNTAVAQPNSTGGVKAFSYQTNTNCSSPASPAVCGSAASGSVAVPTGATPTLQVNTTAVTPNSLIFLNVDESLGTKLGVTCNTALSTLVNPVVTARTSQTSFTIQMNSTLVTNPACVSYFIVN